MSGNRVFALAALALLAGCGGSDEPRNSDYEVEDQGGFDDAAVNGVELNGSAAAVGPMGWQVRAETAGPAAIFTDGRRGPAFALRCDRNRKQIALQLGGGAPGSEAAIEITTAAGEAVRYPGKAIGGAQPRVEARVPIDDSFLTRMAAPGARLTVSAGGDPLIVPGGPAIRRVIEGCRAPAAITGPSFAGITASGSQVSLTLGTEPEPRFRLVETGADGAAVTIVGTFTRLTGERGPILQLVPADRGGTLFLEQIAPDRIVYRTASNDADSALDAAPLLLVRPDAPPPEVQP